MSSRPLLIAHRGDTVHFRENSLEAFASAFTKGADGIECDVQLNRSDLPVVHNYLYDPQKSYPKLENILFAGGSKGRIEIEIKSFTTDFFPDLSSVLSSYPTADIELTSSVLFLFPKLRAIFPKRKLGVIFQPYEFEDWMTEAFLERKIEETMTTLQANVAHIPPQKLSKALIEHLHGIGILIHSHIPRSSPEEEFKLYQHFSVLGIDQCTFDDIDMVKSLT